MPRVNHVKKARKKNPVAEVGEEYYWWAHRTAYGSIKRYSKTYPKRSQLTMSSFLSQMWDIEDDTLGKAHDYESEDDPVAYLEGLRDEAVSELESLRDEVEENLENVPEQLQDSHMLNERRDAVEDMISELEQLDFYGCPEVEEKDESKESEADDESDDERPGDGDDGDEVNEERESWLSEKADELSGILYEGE